MNKNSAAFTLTVAVVLCLCCSVVVAGAAVLLRPMQEKNALIKKQRNVLAAAGLYDAATDGPEQIEAKYAKSVVSVPVQLIDGSLDNTVDVASYSAVDAAKDVEASSPIGGDFPLVGYPRREDVAIAYLVKSEGGDLDKVVMPVYGKGLWSTLYGFLALESDLRTIAGLTFYSHAETPGLGGEVDNPAWKSQWVGKLAYNDEGRPNVTVQKGGYDRNDPNASYMVDGLSGATITSNGVENLVNYWISRDAFGPFLEKIESGQFTLQDAEAAAEKNAAEKNAAENTSEEGDAASDAA